MIDPSESFLAKASECLAGAASELAAGRFDNTGNRSYFACFHAAIAALSRAGVRPRGQWDHDFVQAELVRRLINQTKVYPAELRDTLARTMDVRLAADYDEAPVSEQEARRALRRATAFVSAVQSAGSTT